MPRNSKLKLGLLTGGLMFLVPTFGYAGDFISGSLLWMVGNVVGFIVYLIGLLGALFINLGGYLINLGIGLNQNLINDSLVRLGFDITLDVVNLLFVLVIIIMAFATVLGAESYGLKKTLPKLIMAAFLVNFSLVFAGLIIDFTGVFTKFFIAQATNNNAFALADAITTALAPQALMNPTLLGSIQGGAGAVFDIALAKIILSGLFTAIFTVVEAIVILGTAAMIFIRYINLVLQLIIMPFVWLLWVIPDYSSSFRSWWNSFLQWTFFMPIASFFIYLSIALIAHTDVTSGTSAIGASATTAAGTATDPAVALLGTQDLLKTVGKMIAVIGMLTGGLAVSQKMGIGGAAMAIGMADKARGFITGQAGRLGGRLGAGMVRAGGGTAITNALLQKGGLAEKAAGFLSKTPGLKGVAGGVAARLYNLAASQQASVESVRKEEYSKDSDGAITAKYNQFTTNPVAKAALANEVVKRNLIDKVVPKEHFDKITGKITDTKFDDYLDSAKKMGATKEIIENAPQLAPKIADVEKLEKDFPELATLKAAGDEVAYKEKFEEKAVEAAMSKFRPGKTETLSDKTIEQVGRHFRKEHAERLAKEGDEKQLFALTKVSEILKAEWLSQYPKKEDQLKNPLEHPIYKFAMTSPAARRIILSPKYKTEFEKIRTDVEAYMKEQESRKQRRKGAGREEPPPPGFVAASPTSRLVIPSSDIESRPKQGPPIGIS